MPRTAFRELAEIVRLRKGSHKSPGDGVCAMELVAWMAGEKHNDHPDCVSPVIAAFVPPFNDALDSAHRQRLGAIAARLIDSRGTSGQELARRRLVWDWMIAIAVPTWLAVAQRRDLADHVLAGRAAVLDAVTQSMDARGHIHVRPVNDHRTAATVSRALAVAGVASAFLAGRDAVDGVTGPRARRHWETARALTRTAAWSVAESGWDNDDEAQSRLWRTANVLRESAFILLDRLIAVTEPVVSAPAGAPPAARPAASTERDEALSASPR
jgi:hypothetical protein